MTNRLFIALEIADEALNQIISFRDSVYGTDSSVRWEPKEKLHITLKFLGDTEVNLINEIVEAIRKSVEKHSEIPLEFSKFGMFYRDKNPSILWLGIKRNDALARFFSDIDNALSTIGFKKENRDFKPHLTILRIKGKENFAKLEELTGKPGLDLKFNAKKIILFKSTLLKTGSVYEEVESFLLK